MADCSRRLKSSKDLFTETVCQVHDTNKKGMIPLFHKRRGFDTPRRGF
jgi:hypothetical protein